MEKLSTTPTEKVPEKELKQLGNKLNALMKDLDDNLAIPGHMYIGKNSLNQIFVTLKRGDENHTYFFDIKTGSYKDSFASKNEAIPIENDNGTTSFMYELSSIKPRPLTDLLGIFSSPKVMVELEKQRKEALKSKPKNGEK